MGHIQAFCGASHEYAEGGEKKTRLRYHRGKGAEGGGAPPPPLVLWVLALLAVLRLRLLLLLVPPPPMPPPIHGMLKHCSSLLAATPGVRSMRRGKGAANVDEDANDDDDEAGWWTNASSTPPNW